MKFFKGDKYLTISIVLLIIFMPLSPMIAVYIALGTGYESIILYPISWIITISFCMLPYMLSRVFNKTEEQKEKFERSAKIIGIFLFALFLFFSMGSPLLYRIVYFLRS